MIVGTELRKPPRIGDLCHVRTNTPNDQVGFCCPISVESVDDTVDFEVHLTCPADGVQKFGGNTKCHKCRGTSEDGCFVAVPL